MRKFITILSFFALSGCDVANRVQASGDVMSSKQAYKDCLSSGKTCDTEKAMYEADLKAFNSLKGFGSNSVETTVINNR